MSTKPKTKDDTNDLLRALLIVQLGLAGVPQPTIRAIVKCNINVVSRILKPVLAAKKRNSQKDKSNG